MSVFKTCAGFQPEATPAVSGDGQRRWRWLVQLTLHVTVTSPFLCSFAYSVQEPRDCHPRLW